MNKITILISGLLLALQCTCSAIATSHVDINIKKINLTFAIDGSGNNRTNDGPKGMATNVAKMFELIKADAKFDFSEHGSNATQEYQKNIIGNTNAFKEYLQVADCENDICSVAIYHEGVAHQINKNPILSIIENKSALSTDSIVQKMLDVISEIQSRYPDAKIELSGIGLGKGATALKLLFNEIPRQIEDISNITLKGSVLFDPVVLY